MFHPAFGDTVGAGGKPGVRRGAAAGEGLFWIFGGLTGILPGNNHIKGVKKRGGPDDSPQVVIVPHGMKDHAGLSFKGPTLKLLQAQGFRYRGLYHSHHALVMAALAYPFQFFVAAQFVGPFPFGQVFADPGKIFQPVFPQEEAVYRFRVEFNCRHDGVKAAHSQFVSHFVVHKKNIPENKQKEQGPSTNNR
jgi:hypothetical protein